MKKLLFLLLLVTPLFASASGLDHDLSFGLRNNADVKKLQQFLMDQKVYAGDVNGNFFSMTQKAVKAFQAGQGIVPASGYVGSKTRARINALFGSSPNTQPIVAKSEPAPQVQPSPQTTPQSTPPSPTMPPPTIPAPTPQPPQQIVAPSNTILCSGKYWTPCVSGQFYCPANGDATCIEEVPTPTANKSYKQPETPQRQIYQIIPFGDVSIYSQDEQAFLLAAYNELKQTPDIQYLTPQQQNELFKQILTKYVLQYKAQLQQQAQRESDHQKQINDQIKALSSEYKQKMDGLDSQIIAIKQQYYIDVENAKKNPYMSQNLLGLKMQKLTDDANLKIDQIQTQQESLRFEYRNKINSIQ